MTSAQFQVRTASGPSDTRALASLRREWNRSIEDPGFEERFAAWLHEEGSRRTAWLAERKEAVIGMGTMLEYRRMPLPGQNDGAWGYIGSMFVREHHRGTGVGAGLLAAMLAEADRRAYVRVVLSPSARATRFYERAGFVAPDGVAGDRLLVRTRPG